jgi:succinate dehydrogenase/fumarate reductase-like Fe-S protein
MLKNAKEINVLVYRSFSALGTDGKKEEYQKYTIPFVERMTILDVLNYIYENYGKNLSYYYSCRIGKCNGCIVNVNGKNKHACTTLAKDGIKISPAKGFRIVKDLLVNFSREDKNYL